MTMAYQSSGGNYKDSTFSISSAGVAGSSGSNQIITKQFCLKQYRFEYNILTLKIPLPTKTPSQPSCIVRITSAGVAIPPAANVTTGSLPISLTYITKSRFTI